MNDTPFSFSSHRLSRRAAVRAGGLGVAGSLAFPGPGPSFAQEATPEAIPAQTDLVQDGLSAEIIEIFSALPGTNGLRLWAPPDAGRPAWSATLNADRQVFIASAFKTFVLAEYLRQAEETLDSTASTSITNQLNAQLAEQLTLDESVFSPGATVFNPPHLTGLVTTRTVLEAMISHSDNTAADMALRRVGPERVRQLIASLGLTQTRIPDSTRQFIGYIFGVPDWRAFTWAQFEALPANDPYPPRPILNPDITMASSADDLVAFYTRALRGEIFRYPETLAVYLAILSLADAIALVMPLGVNAFLKGGSLQTETNNALTVAGGMYVPDRWVYFATLLNWTAAEAPPLSEFQAGIADSLNRIFTLVRDRLGT